MLTVQASRPAASPATRPGPRAVPPPVMAWNSAQAASALRNWLEALKVLLNQLVPNRAWAPALSLAAATSAPIGPAAKVSPRWAKIDADQKLAAPESTRTAVAARRKEGQDPNSSTDWPARRRTVAAAAPRAPAASSPT